MRGLPSAAQARKDEGATKKRIKESERRIDTSLDPFIQKKYWCATTLPSGHDSPGAQQLARAAAEACAFV